MMNKEDINFIAAELQKEFGVPVEISESKDPNRWAFYRLAAEYGEGKGKPKQLINRAIKYELLGGDVVLELKVWIVNQLKNPRTPPDVRTFLENVLEKINAIRDEMAEEIMRRYKEPSGMESLISLFRELETMKQNDTVDHLRTEVFEALQDIVC
jgi:hypothetical protein